MLSKLIKNSLLLSSKPLPIDGNNTDLTIRGVVAIDDALVDTACAVVNRTGLLIFNRRAEVEECGGSLRMRAILDHAGTGCASSVAFLHVDELDVISTVLLDLHLDNVFIGQAYDILTCDDALEDLRRRCGNNTVAVLDECIHILPGFVVVDAGSAWMILPFSSGWRRSS